MANKKGAKGGKGGKGNGGKPGPQKPSKPQVDASKEQFLAPQERVDAVRPLWESLPAQERVSLLTVDLGTLRERARQLYEMAKQQQAAALGEGLELVTMVGMDRTLEEVLDEGCQRLKNKTTWKLWTWMPDNEEFFDAEAFRTFITEKHIREELRKLLPRDDPKSAEKPAESAFRLRMVALLQKVQLSNRPLGEETGPAPPGGRGTAYRRRQAAGDGGLQAARDANVELINVILEALEKEHECLYQLLLQPVTAYVMEVLPEPSRDTAKSELAYEDLERIQPEDAAHIVEWLTEKVDALSTKLKADPKEEEEEDDEEGMGDVDLWSLVNEDKALTVNEKWLQHLQERLLGEDGHPRKGKPGEDPLSNGLVLEWVYGSIVSTAEKARDGAKRCIGNYMPMANEAYGMLLRGLEDQYIWETRGRQAKDLMSEMLKSRIEAQELAKQYDIRPVPKPALEAGEVPPPVVVEEVPQLPDSVIVSMLRREALLTKAKLHYLVFEHLQQDKAVRTLKAQLKQGEPEFERLKRELDEVKHAHRGLDGTYRSAAEMERHRAQLADAAIEEQLEVQTAFREQGARLQGVYDKKQRSEYEMAKRETEIKQLQGWKGTVENLIDKFQEVLSAVNSPGCGELALQATEAGVAASLEILSSAAKVEDTAAGADPAHDPGSVNPAEDATEADAALKAAFPPVAAAAGNGGVAAEVVKDNSVDMWEERGDPELSPHQYMQLAKLRTHFHKDVRKQLYGEKEDKQFFDWLKQEIKVIEKRVEESRVALQHLEMHLINTACDDPGATIGMQLALPILQERLDAQALEFAAQRALMAESEIIKMEAEQQEREAAERDRKLKAKQGKKDKVRCEREKALGEKAARDAAEQERRAVEAATRMASEEEERQRRLVAVEGLRREEEESMERRRQELLSDKDGYWRRRMEAEAKAAEVAVSVSKEDDDVRAIAEDTGSPAPLNADKVGDEEGFVAGKRRRKREQEAAALAAAAHSALSASRPREAQQHSGRSRGGGDMDTGSRGGRSQLAGGGNDQTRPGRPAQGRLPPPPPVSAAAPPAASMTANRSSPSEIILKVGRAVPAAAVEPVVNAVAPIPVAPSTPQPGLPPGAQQTALPEEQTGAGISPAAPNAAPSAPAQEPAPGLAAGLNGEALPLPPAVPQKQQALVPAVPGAVEPVPMSDAQQLGGPALQGGPAVRSLPRPAHLAPPPPFSPSQPQMMMSPQPMHGMGPGQGMPMRPMPMHLGHQQPQQQHQPGLQGSAPPPMHNMRGMPQPGMVMQGMPQGPYQGGMPHPGMVGPGGMPMVQGPNGPVYMYPPPGPPMMHHAGHMGHMQQMSHMGHMGHMQHHMGAHMPQQQQQQQGPPQPPASPNSGVNATTPPQQQQLAGKPAGLNVGAQAFIPMSWQQPSMQQQQPQPQGQQGMAYGVPVGEPGMGLHYRPQQQQQHMMLQQQQYSGAPQMKNQRPLSKGALPLQKQVGAGDAGRQDDGGPEGWQQQQPGLPATQPVRTMNQGTASRSAAKDSPSGCWPESPVTPLDHAENSDGSANTDEGAALQASGQGELTEEGAATWGACAAQEEVEVDHGSGRLVPQGDEGEVECSSSSCSPPSLSKNASWSSEATAEPGGKGGANMAASVSSMSPSSSSFNVAESALGDASAGPAPAASASSPQAVGTWKQKLQCNIQAKPLQPPAAPPAKQFKPKGPSPAALQQQQIKQLQPSLKQAYIPSRTSSLLMKEPQKHLPGALRRLPGGRFEFVAAAGKGGNVSAPLPRALSLVRGLMNGGAENNCFLNVIVQSLWHLPSFRGHILGLPLDLIEGKAAAAEDKRVLMAIWSMFRAMSQEGDDSAAALSPRELRAGLCGQSAIHVDPTDMHDAGEVFGEILGMMHRADLGRPASEVRDVQLPVKVKVMREPHEEVGAAAAALLAPQSPYAAALKVGAASAASDLPAASTLVHSLFGLDMQLPCPAADEGGEAAEGSRSGSAGGKGRRSPPLPAAAPRSTRDVDVVEVQRFTKFFHLVAAQGLKRVSAAKPMASFEALLVEVEASGQEKRGMAESTQQQPLTKVLRRPAVFALALVWDSPQAPVESIRGTVEALGCEVDLAGVFAMPLDAAGQTPSTGGPYRLRSVVCYFGHHYLIFVMSEELQTWLLIDDDEAQLVGNWGAVCRTMVARRLQPSLLFYEDGLWGAV